MIWAGENFRSLCRCQPTDHPGVPSWAQQCQQGADARGTSQSAQGMKRRLCQAQRSVRHFIAPSTGRHFRVEANLSGMCLADDGEKEAVTCPASGKKIYRFPSLETRFVNGKLGPFYVLTLFIRWRMNLTR